MFYINMQEIDFCFQSVPQRENKAKNKNVKTSLIQYCQ